ncbi:hypothetical protein G436_2825 [Leptospira interrogans serovar Hardjo str. Norma]|uniref:Uncharacterized protein n=1 Tax=Leptospira interrogans serovar Hardjo str. Norma TaxID=1279460 RepID=A0A0M4N9S9_LEPIR|nr:hypothetical protein G436_2825 [Leptospira interrogans serovar Hardjo str. Norma]
MIQFFIRIKKTDTDIFNFYNYLKNAIVAINKTASIDFFIKSLSQNLKEFYAKFFRNF